MRLRGLRAEQPPRCITDTVWRRLVTSTGSVGLLLSHSADRRPSVVFVSNAVFWALSQATQSKPPAGLRIVPFY